MRAVGASWAGDMVVANAHGMPKQRRPVPADASPPLRTTTARSLQPATSRGAACAGMRTNTPDREAFDFFRALIVALPIGLALWAGAVVGLLALR